MQVIQFENIEWKRGLQHRGGTFHYRHMFDGTPDTPGNFQFNIGRIEGDFTSPRHRHNFEQFRFQIEGVADFARNGKMGAGTFGYFPEGASYGPQSSPGGTALTAVLQFGGASGSGYLSRKQVGEGQKELDKFGKFEAGIFKRNDDVEGRRNTDGYQAIWEHYRGRQMEYPKPRVRDPVMIDVDHYEWAPVGKGVSERPMGVFSERRAEANLIRIEAGATWPGKGRSIYLVIEGAGSVGGETYTTLTGVNAAEGETPTFKATAETVVLHLGLPNLAGLEDRLRATVATAAE
jgi:hypothetical protein